MPSWRDHLPDRNAALKLFLACWLICVAVYGYDLFVFTFSIDEESNTFLGDQEIGWLTSGRWGGYILSVLFFPPPPVPVVPQLVAISGLAAAYVISACTWRREIGAAHFIAAPFALGFPILINLMGFAHVADVVMIGLALMALAVFILHAAARRGPLLAIPLMTFAFSIYQPVALYGPTTFLILAALSYSRLGLGELSRRFLRFALCFIASVLLAELILKIWLYVRGIEFQYGDQFIRFDLFALYPIEILQRTVAFSIAMFMGFSEIFPGGLLILGPTLALAGLMALWAWGWRAGLMLIAALCVPAFAPMINGGTLPYRTLLALPIAVAGLVFAAACAPIRARMLFAVLSAYCALQFALIGNRMNYAAYLAWLNDRALADRLIARIEAIEPQPHGITLEVVGMPQFADSPQRPVIHSSTLGASFFRWDDGNEVRIALFLKTMGYDVNETPPDKHLTLFDRVRQMPSWPAEGAVQLIDGVVVVKFSDYTRPQRVRYGLPAAAN